MVNPVIYDFEELSELTIMNSLRLMEFFRMHLIYYQLVSGMGLEFDRIKEFTQGGNPRHIDWKVFARTGKLFERAYKEERNFKIIIVVDVSESMLLGTSNVTKSQFASMVAGALGYAALSAGDRIAIVLYSDSVDIQRDPTTDIFEALQPLAEVENYGGLKDWKDLTIKLISNYTENSIIFLVSDFIDTDPDGFLSVLSANFTKVYGVAVRDPIDDVIPEDVGRVYLKDPETNKTILVDTSKIVDEYRAKNRVNMAKIKEVFHEYGQLFFSVRTDEPFDIEFVKAFAGEEVIVY